MKSFSGKVRTEGITLIELLIVMAIFLVVLGVLGSFFISSTRAYRVTERQSEAFQDAESVLQLLQYELGLAGYRGVNSNYDRTFSGGDQSTVVLTLGDSSDEIQVRYFEDAVYLPALDSGERAVTFFVDTTSQTLMRGQGDVNQEMVANVVRLQAMDYIQRNRVLVPVRSGGTPNPVPDDLAGINLFVEFSDGRNWTFTVSFTNPQDVTAN